MTLTKREYVALEMLKMICEGGATALNSTIHRKAIIAADSFIEAFNNPLEDPYCSVERLNEPFTCSNGMRLKE